MARATDCDHARGATLGQAQRLDANRTMAGTVAAAGGVVKMGIFKAVAKAIEWCISSEDEMKIRRDIENAPKRGTVSSARQAHVDSFRRADIAAGGVSPAGHFGNQVTRKDLRQMSRDCLKNQPSGPELRHWYQKEFERRENEIRSGKKK